MSRLKIFAKCETISLFKTKPAFCGTVKEILAQDSARQVTICRVSIEQIIGLRHRLLRDGLPFEAAQFPGDNDSSTWHIGAFYPWPPNENAPLVSAASFMLKTYQEKPAWQLRGMCTDDVYQGKGFGGRLLSIAEKSILKDSNTRLFWCNARVPAIPFYLKHGWTVDSEEFDILTAGPHRKMMKRI